MAKLDEMSKAELVESIKRSRKAKANKNKNGQNIGNMLAQKTRQVGKLAQQAGNVYGVTNPIITVGTGRNLLNPDGNLNKTRRNKGQQIPLTNPFDGSIEQNDRIMIDSWGILAGSAANFPGAPDDKFGSRFKGAVAAVRYNARSSITPGGGIATTWWPVILGPLVGSGARMALNGAAAFVKAGSAFLPKRAGR